MLNMPQSAILGMHGIKERPVVVDGEIVARPMMYVALTYDHRLIDGRESVAFLKVSQVIICCVGTVFLENFFLTCLLLLNSLF